MFTFGSSIPDLYHPTERKIQYIKIRLLRLFKTNNDDAITCLDNDDNDVQRNVQREKNTLV